MVAGSAVKTGVAVNNLVSQALPMDPVHPSARSTINIGALASSFPIQFDVSEPGERGAVQSVLPTVNVYTDAHEWVKELSFLMKGEQRYQILIANKDTTQEDELSKHPVGTTSIRKNRAVSLATWNFISAITEPMPNTPEEVRTPSQAIAGYTFKGPVISEFGQHVFYREKNFGRKRARMFNSAFWGYVPVTNIWGEDIRPGTRLYLILKKVLKTPETYEVDAMGQSIRTYEFATKMGGSISDTITDRPFQLIPWANFEKYEPRKEDLEYFDEFGQKHLGMAIFVGELIDYGSGETALGTRERFHPYKDGKVVANGTLPIYWVQWRCKI
jgi:hypothetical protein